MPIVMSLQGKTQKKVSNCLQKTTITQDAHKHTFTLLRMYCMLYCTYSLHARLHTFQYESQATRKSFAEHTSFQATTKGCHIEGEIGYN